MDVALRNRPSSQLGAAALRTEVHDIYVEHFSRVWRSLRRLGVEESLLEDAVQDVFVVVHRRWDSFAWRSAVSTWVYGITVRVAKDYRRSAVRHTRRLSHLLEHQTVPGSVDCPSAELERREAGRLLHAVLGALSEREREVLVLVELEGLSVREVATIVGTSVRTCQRRLRTARHGFEAALRRCQPASGRPTP